MRSFKTGVVSIAFASVVGMAAVIGCSASGGDDTVTDGDPTEPAPVATLPPGSGSSSSGDAPVTDAGKKDSGKKAEAGVDAGPPPPVAGDPCTMLNVEKTKACGMCGTASTVCLDDGSGVTGKWSDYSACGDERGTCLPGTVTTEACGNCGTLTKTCNQYCAFSASSCTGQPMNSCVPGTVDYTGAGCTDPSTYRNRTCGAACTFGNYSATCSAPVNSNKFDIGAAVGAVTSQVLNITGANHAGKLTGTCPGASIAADTTNQYEYVEIHNPTAKAAKVSIYGSPAAGGPTYIDTVMAIYSTAIQPMSATARQACAYGVNDESTDTSLTVNVHFSLIKAVPIPAGGSVLVYVGNYYEPGDQDFDTELPAITTGKMTINAKIETLN